MGLWPFSSDDKSVYVSFADAFNALSLKLKSANITLQETEVKEIEKIVIEIQKYHLGEVSGNLQNFCHGQIMHIFEELSKKSPAKSEIINAASLLGKYGAIKEKAA